MEMHVGMIPLENPMRYLKRLAAAVFLFFSLCVPVRADVLNPVSQQVDWQAQDYVGRQGIRAVSYQRGALVLQAHLIGKDATYGQGEVLLDLRYVSGLESRVPLDFSGRTIAVEIIVPAGFVGVEGKPNGVQLFVKDSNWNTHYGEWTNIVKKGAVKAALTPMVKSDSAFDPTKIRVVGVKFSIGRDSTATYDGPLVIKKMKFKPSIMLASAPCLPASTPKPVITSRSVIELKTDGFYLDGKRWRPIGGNWRIIEYGQNFGGNAWYPAGNGVSKHATYLKAQFDLLKRAGVKVVRIGVLDDGRCMLDSSGTVVADWSVFRRDVASFMDMARDAGIKVELVLVDFLVAGKAEQVGDVWVRGRGAILADAVVRERFIATFLIPFLAEFGSHPALFGFDVINEPEWLVAKAEGGGWEDADAAFRPEAPISLSHVTSFLNGCIAAIRKGAPGKFVTTGVSVKFASLVAAVAALDVDYRALHHYRSMGSFKDCSIPGGKPWLLEEYPAYDKEDASLLISSYLDLIAGKGGQGALVWSLSPGIDDYSPPIDRLGEALLELRTWVDQQ